MSNHDTEHNCTDSVVDAHCLAVPNKKETFPTIEKNTIRKKLKDSTIQHFISVQTLCVRANASCSSRDPETSVPKPRTADSRAPA